LPYEFQIVECDNGQSGAILSKLDHTMSDALGMITLCLTLSDNFDESMIPKILKLKPNFPFYVKIALQLFELLMFPYYSFRLLMNNQVYASEENPFKRATPPTGQTVFGFTKTYDFNKFRIINKKINCTFNDLLMAIISSSISKYCDKYYPNDKYIYKQLICGVPIGIKDLAKCPKDAQLKNDFLGAMSCLKRINDPIKEIHLITDETKKTVRNITSISAWKYLSAILSQCLPYSAHKIISANLGANVDLAISNLPGPTKAVKYCGSEVTDVLPIMSLGFGKAFIIIGTYNNTVRIVVNLDKNVNIDLDKMIETMDNEISSVLETVKDEKIEC